MREGFTLFFVELSLSFFFFCPLLLPMMPPKRGKGAHTAKRGDETPRQPDDGRVTVAVAPTGITTSCALDRRPHHLVSRRHPPWSAPGCINSGGNHLQSLHTSGAASSKAAAPPTRSRAVPPTRVAERSVVAQKDDHKDTAATTTVRPSAAARRSGATKTAGQKRFRSPSASNPIEVKSENSAEAEEKEESRERTSGTPPGTRGQGAPTRRRVSQCRRPPSRHKKGRSTPPPLPPRTAKPSSATTAMEERKRSDG